MYPVFPPDIGETHHQLTSDQTLTWPGLKEKKKRQPIDLK